MGRYLLCCTPLRSHIGPMLTIAVYLKGRGHEVRLLTGRAFEDKVRGLAVEFVPLPEACDYDDTDLDAAFPGRHALGKLDRMRFDAERIFLDAIPLQRAAVEQLIEDDRPDAILIDPAFAGALPLLLLPADGRPPILKAGLTPLMFSSRDTAPFGMKLAPATSAVGRLRNRALYGLGSRTFRSTERHGAEVLRREGCAAPGVPLFDWGLITDRYLQYSIPELDYPRSDLPPHVSFMGPLPAQREANFNPPDWWQEILNAARPVIYVTQGTVDNGDLTRILAPSLAALADLEVLVVATTGRATAEVPCPVPANARVAPYVPHGHLLPHVDLMITNGGFGGVQHALAHGVPLVIGGDTEDKPEVAARVAWCKAGVNLRTATPKTQQVRRAVQEVLTEPTFRQNAQRLAQKMAAMSALSATEAALSTAEPMPPAAHSVRA